MQLRLSFVAAALVLSTAAAAAAVPQAQGNLALRGADSNLESSSSSSPLVARLSKSQFESQAASIAKKATAQINGDLSKLESLQKNSKPSEAEAHRTFSDLNSHLESFGDQYAALAAKYHGSSTRSLEARQALLQPAIADLNKSLNKVLPQVRLTLRHLTTNLGLNTVSVIIKQITPGLKKIDLGLEQILTVVADDAGPTLVDPLLRTVYGLLDGLGLNLNARDVSSDIDARASKSSTEASLATEVKHVSSEFESDYATFKKLLSQKHVSESEFSSAVNTLKSHAKSATAKVHSLHSQAQQSGLIQRAQPGDLTTAVNVLIVDLNKLLPLVDTLVHKVVGDLELNLVNQLVDGLTPLLTGLIGGVEALLAGLAPALSPLVDPLLALVNQITKGLGIDLNNDTGKL